jgi:hypothetical protein
MISSVRHLINFTFFPLTGLFSLIGLVVAVVLGLCTQNLTLLLSGWVLFVSCSLVWHRTLPPVFPFCLAYQWVFSVTGPIVYYLRGDYPGGCDFVSLDKAVLYSQFGFLLLAFGLRVGMTFIKDGLEQSKNVSFQVATLRHLFFTALICSVLAWVVPFSRIAAVQGISQISSRVAMVLTVPFIVFTLYCLQHRVGLVYFAIAFIIAWLPAFASQMSAFSYLLLVCTVCLLSFWRPWAKSAEERIRSGRILLSLIGCVIALTIAAVIWNGSIKPIWRIVEYNEEAPGPILDRLSEFGEVSQFALTNFRIDNAIDDTFPRFSSDVAYFSLVLARVPQAVPHANGALTAKALYNAVVPRLLFPQKDIVVSDSEVTMTYAGIDAASDEQDTSIGMGYMAYFYIDFGFPGMLIGIFFQGLFWGIAGSLLWNAGRNYFLSSAGLIVFGLNNCMGYGSDIAKSFGGAVITLIIFFIVLKIAGRSIAGWLLESNSQRARVDLAVDEV